MAQDIYITPKQILLYLKDFEEKLPLPRRDYFVSTLKITPLSIDALNQEVNQMAEFMGLNGFSANCKWVSLPKGIGGEILLDNRKSGTLDIKVNEEYKFAPEVTCATLAHEICHKYLQLHGIYYPKMTAINEIFTDLCTMYVGFGNIILKGYSTKNWKSGYLEYPIYQHTNTMIRMIIWGEKYQDIKEQSEPFLDEALRIWMSDDNKRNLSRKEYIKVYAEYTEYQKNVEIFKQLLYMMEEEPLKLAKEIDDKMYQPIWFDGEDNLKQKIACFVGLYQGLIIKENFKDTPIYTVNRYLKHVIAQMVDAIGRKRFTSENIYRLQFECPYCKHKASISPIANKETIVKCPNCNKRFAVDGNPFDLTAARKDLAIYRNEIRNKIRRELKEENFRLQKDAYSKGYTQGYSKGKELITKDLNALQAKIDNLPKWLKWLIGDRIKK